ncbi:MAG: hypothetical protein QW678_00155 [Candidatus Aenigmatarchaeota archaeon]|nr:hypothetical protein [Candidatus Aenigmarchaeota archaeon]
MGKVLVTIRVISENENQEKEIIEKIKPEKYYKKPFVFGIEALYLEKIISDEAGELEKIEEVLNNLNVSYEIEKITRIFID